MGRPSEGSARGSVRGGRGVSSGAGARTRGPPEGRRGARPPGTRCVLAPAARGCEDPPVPDPERERTWLRRLRDLSRDLARERDLRALLPRIVDAAIELTRAERGFLVRVRGRSRSGRPKLQVAAARGFSRETLQGGLSKVSRTVVETVLERGEGLLTSREEDAFVRNLTSVQRRNVLAILCVPLLLRREVAGVLYLDHRFQPEAFAEGDVPIVEAFAEQAALAIETAELAGEIGALREQLGRAASEVEALRVTQEVPGGEVCELPDPEHLPRQGRLFGGSPALRALWVEVERAARSTAPVAIWGETGVGKELVARELHRLGSAPEAPFVAENCAAVAEGVLESELFGHVRGAYTGAQRSRDGLFVRAGDGTVFLDEIADTSPKMQAKLLRVLQEGRVRPVGGSRTVPFSARVVVASHRNLAEEVRAGRFREDLYYRLDVLRLVVPPLRERREDVPVLLSHFFAGEGIRPRFDRKAIELLLAYAWPGNVRELENEARRLATLDAPLIEARHLSPEVRGVRSDPAGRVEEAKTLPEVERRMIEDALRRFQNNKTRAAKSLGIPKTTFYRLLDRHGLR
ncbi:MAG: sigma-54-dependent Fis family transcriptional regulator [Planctomycetota bacterium]|nr:MAG: sigma-54-dependent Fis family transcriptional regulator [Planctomycetota bacterium]